jgi:arsenate reductase-like glutaredoxin family protein
MALILSHFEIAGKIESMTSVQIFGVKSSPETRAAERFFKERRTPIHLVDLAQKPMSPGEIKRFVDRFGILGLMDREGKAYADSGLKYLKVSDTELLAKIERQPKLLKLPLVRCASRISVGRDENAWAQMLEVRK